MMLAENFLDLIEDDKFFYFPLKWHQTCKLYVN